MRFNVPPPPERHLALWEVAAAQIACTPFVTLTVHNLSPGGLSPGGEQFVMGG